MNKLSITLFLVLTTTTSIFSSTEKIEMKRLALVFGSNFGGKDRVTLQYAHTDAYAFSKVLTDLGGVNKKDLNLVLEPNIKKFSQAISELKEKAIALGPKHRRVEVIVYYSGHSDEEGLLLGEEKFYYQDFKKQVTSIPADIRIAVLDACASGALTRLKGGKKSKPFLVDETTDMQGYAFLTSNSEDEVAQESDRIQGSYFTHNLNSGLRGAADMTNDGKVTLNEAYQYAFHETLAKTEKTQGGAQHAGYDIQISGSGEVVMTDLRSISSAVVLPENMEGKIYIRDDQKKLMAELQKFKGRSVSLGLEPGTYGITLERQPAVLFSKIELIKGKEFHVRENNFIQVNKVQTVSRGGKPSANTLPYDTVAVSYSIFPPIHRKDGVSGVPRFYHNYSLNFIGGYYHKLEGIGVGLFFQVAQESVDGGQVSIVHNRVAGNLNGFQAAAVLNYAKDVTGGQASSLFNTAENVTGGQGSGLGNAVKNLEGGQGAGLFNFAWNVKGGQGAGLFNIAKHVTGGQGAGLFNVSLDVLGGQGSGLFNVSRNIIGGQGSGLFNAAVKVHGFQASGLFNVSGNMIGPQASGLFNVSGNHTGLQVAGLFNISHRLKGVQIGVINIAREVEGETIGILNLNSKARYQPSIWYDEGGYTNFMLMTGHKIFYGNINMGVLSDRDEPFAENIAVTAGIGAHLIRNPVTLNLDLSDGMLWKNEDVFNDIGNQLIRLRMSLGFPLLKYLNPTVGVSFNLMHHQDKSLNYQNYLYTKKFADNSWSYWTGFFTGISF